MGRKECMKTELGPALCCEGCPGCTGTAVAIRAIEPTLAQLNEQDRVDVANFMHDVAHAVVDVVDDVLQVVSTTKYLFALLRMAPTVVREEPAVLH